MAAADGDSGFDSSGHLLQGLILAEFALLAVLSVMKKLLCSKSNHWCAYKTTVLALLIVDSVMTLVLVVIAIVGADHSFVVVLHELIVIGVKLLTLAVGFYGTVKEHTTVLMVYQALLVGVGLLLRLAYLIAQIPIWYFMDNEFDKMEMFIMKICLMPYIFLVIFYHTMANELRKELQKEQDKKKEKEKEKAASLENGVPQQPSSDAEPVTREATDSVYTTLVVQM